MKSSELCIVVRAAGERTADVCCARLRRQAPDAPFYRVEQVPFWRTLREGLQRGLDSGKAWIISVDADVLPGDDAIEKALRWIEMAAPETGVITGMVQDKLFCSARYMAFRVYRAGVLQDMLDMLPPEGTEVRPESTTITRLAERGWAHQKVPDVVGLHDYEQFFGDLHRKAFLHAHKHVYFAQRILPLWRTMAAIDTDYQMALEGFADGIRYLGAADCRIADDSYRIGEALARLGVQEKASYANPDLCVDTVLADVRGRKEQGLIFPVDWNEQSAFDYALVSGKLDMQVLRVCEQLAAWSATSPETASAVVSGIRRCLPGYLLLHDFSIRELFVYLILREGSFMRGLFRRMRRRKL